MKPPETTATGVRIRNKDGGIILLHLWFSSGQTSLNFRDWEGVNPCHLLSLQSRRFQGGET